MDTTQEQEVVRGLLPFTIDGEIRNVRELKWRPNREWQALLEATFGRLGTIEADTPAGQRAMGDAQRELILAYDARGCPDFRADAPEPCHATHALGDLEGATERELDDIYDRLLEVAYPKAESQTALVMAIVRAALQAARASSPNGPSPSGTIEAPTSSKPRSRSARSSSSARRRRSA